MGVLIIISCKYNIIREQNKIKQNIINQYTVIIINNN